DGAWICIGVAGRARRCRASLGSAAAAGTDRRLARPAARGAVGEVLARPCAVAHVVGADVAIARAGRAAGLALAGAGPPRRPVPSLSGLDDEIAAARTAGRAAPRRAGSAAAALERTRSLIASEQRRGGLEEVPTKVWVVTIQLPVRSTAVDADGPS